MIRERLAQVNWDGIIFFAVVFAVWEIAAMLMDVYYFPRASAVAVDMWNERGVLVIEALHTLRRAAQGFLIALAIALPLGLLIGRIPLLADMFEPLTEFLRPLPPIAIIPLAMMLLGIGDAAKLVVIVFGAAFPILINTIDAVRVQDPVRTWAARSLRLSTFETMVLVDLPAALPRIVAGVRIAVGVSLLLAVVSEMILSTDGLGDYVRKAQTAYSMARVTGGIVVIALLSIMVSAVTNAISRRVTGWHISRSAAAGV